MATPTTLNEYYASQGQTLPSVSARQQAAAQAGIQNYTGTAAQNQQLLSSFNSNQRTTPITPVVPATVATNNQTQTQLPTRPTPDTSSLSGMATGFINSPLITNLNQLGKKQQIDQYNANLAQSNADRSAQDVYTQMTSGNRQLEREANIEGLSQNVTDAMNAQTVAKSNYDATELRYRREVENTMTNGALTADQKQANINEIERKKASQLADIAIDYNLKVALLTNSQTALSNAKSLLEEKKKNELEPKKFMMDYYSKIADKYGDKLTASEKLIIEQLQKKEERAYQAGQKELDRKYSLMKDAIDKGVYTSDMSKLSANGILKKLAENQGKKAGVPTAVAEKIGESKVGQKVNSTIDLTNSLKAYQKMYNEYYTSGNLKSIEAIKNLGVLRNDLNQKYSVANGQGAVQQGDRESYQKIISGGILLPETALKQMDTLISTFNNSTQNDIKFLDKTYQGYASQFFADQLAQLNAEQPSNDLDTTITSSVKQAVTSGYTPDEIVSKLLNTNIADKIQTALNSGWTNQDIVNYLTTK